MKILNNEEMINVKGGALSSKVLGIITGVVAGIITFAVGAWDGYINPKSCKR